MRSGPELDVLKPWYSFIFRLFMPG